MPSVGRSKVGFRDEMKLGKLGEVLRAASAVPTWSAALQSLCPLFDSYATTSVSDFVKLARAQRIKDAKASSGPYLIEAAKALRMLRAIVAPIAKTGDVKELDEFINVISGKGELSVDVFVSSLVASASKRERQKEGRPVDENLIDKYVTRLERALGNERAFLEVFNELRDDETMPQERVVAVANRFMGRTPASTSRPKALERIRQRHAKLMKFKSRTEGMAGKSAA